MANPFDLSQFFNSFVLIQPTEADNAVVTNVIPHSLPNAIVTAVEH